MTDEVTDPELLKRLNAPEEVTDPAILARLNEDPNRSWGDRLFGGAKAAGQGVLDAGTGLVGMPGDILPHFKGSITLPGKEYLDKMLTSAGIHYDPQNLGERYVRAATEGIGSMIGPGVPGKVALIVGALSGLGGEAGRALFNDPQTGDPLGHTLGTAAPAAGLIAAKTAVKHFVPTALIPPILDSLAKWPIPNPIGVARGIARSLLQQNLSNYPAKIPPTSPPSALQQQADTLAQ